MLDVGVPEITPVDEFKESPVAKEPDNNEYVTEDPPSESVADNVVEYAEFLVNTGRLEDVTHTGEFPAVIEFEDILTEDPIGAVTPGFVIVTVYGLPEGGKLSGRVTIS